MSFWDPFWYASHLVKSGIGRTINRARFDLSSTNDVFNLRNDLQSYESRCIFDAHDLAKNIKTYQKLKKKLMIYRGQKGHESLYVNRIFNKYKKNPRVLKGILAYEVKVFSDYFEAYLNTIKKIQFDDSQLNLIKNLKLMKEEATIRIIIENLSKHNNQSATVVGYKEILIELRNLQIRLQRKESVFLRKEYKNRVKLIQGKNPIISYGLLGIRALGMNFLAHKFYKLNSKIWNKDYRYFLIEFSDLLKETERGVTPEVTVKVHYFLKNYYEILEYSHKVENDFLVIFEMLLQDFREVMDECVIPFYAAIKNVSGASKIMEDSKILKESYNDYVKELESEDMEIKKVYQSVISLAEECDSIKKSIEANNERVIQELTQKMRI